MGVLGKTIRPVIQETAPVPLMWTTGAMYAGAPQQTQTGVLGVLGVFMVSS